MGLRVKRCNYCGTEFSVSTFFLIRLLLHKKVYKTCPVCRKTSCYKLIFHIVHEGTDKREKELNGNIRKELLIR